MSRKQKKSLIRIIIAAVLFAAGYIVPFAELPAWIEPCSFAAVYLVIGYDVLWKAVRGLFSGQFLDENFLMAIASVGAFCLRDYREAVMVVLLYQVGELFQSCAVSKSRKSISALMDIRPDSANLERDGAIEEVSPEEVKIGDIIVIRPGEKIPLDCTVEEGSSSVDTSSVTGESVPRDVNVGSALISGCVNISGLLRCRVTAEFGESTVSKILELVENAGEHKARAENFITRFTRVYTPVVVGAAVLLAVVPSLFDGQWSEWISRALTFLVISCPCALVISVPMSFFGGIGGASRRGILIKGAEYLEQLANVKTMVFDKTGTLTEGSFKVTQVNAAGCTKKEDLVEAAAYAEAYSHHPIAQSLRAAYGSEPDASRLSDVSEIPGQGISAKLDNEAILAGNALLMKNSGVDFTVCDAVGTIVYVARGGNFLGSIVISDTVKPDSAEAIKKLRERGVERTIMLTGDSESAGQAVAKQLGIDEAHCGLLPGDKAERVEKLLSEKNGVLAFVGDGVNDAPVLTRADIGIAMGGIGSDAAIEAADIVIMDDKPSKIPLAVGISRKTLRIVKENIVFALGIKALFLLLGALGFAGMWAAVFADVGVSIIAILNATRALRTKNL